MKNYEVTKYTATQTIYYGTLTADDLKAVLKGCKYDADLGMWFDKKANAGYDVTEIQ